MALNLSKTLYCSAIQCPKMLWLNKNKPEEADDSVVNQSVFENGREVGDVAKRLFGDFTEVPYGNLSRMIEKTAELIGKGTDIIAEASFSYDGLFCSVDILKNLGGNNVEIYEVKSATSVYDIYYHDAGYQYYVLTKLGYNVKRVCVVYVNNKYVRVGELDISQLFNIADITEMQ